MTQQETGTGALTHGQGHAHLTHVWARPEPTRWDLGAVGGSGPAPPSHPLSSLPSGCQCGGGRAMASLLCNARECPGRGEVQGRAEHWAIRFYPGANLAWGLSSPCCTLEHP